MTSKNFNLLAAWTGALAGLAVMPHPPNETVVAAACAAILIFALGYVKHRPSVALTLCALLGLACTRFTVSIVS